MGLLQLFMMHKAQQQGQTQQQGMQQQQANQQAMQGLINQMMQANQSLYSRAAGGGMQQMGPYPGTHPYQIDNVTPWGPHYYQIDNVSGE